MTEHVAGTIKPLELLPCPFCGSDRITVWNIRDGVQVVCKDCKATGTPTYFGKEGAAGAVRDAKSSWNRRAILPAQGQDEPVAVWRSINTAPMGFPGNASTHFIGARQDGNRINTATCYRNEHGAYEWFGGGMTPTHWQPLDPLDAIHQPRAALSPADSKEGE